MMNIYYKKKWMLMMTKAELLALCKTAANSGDMDEVEAIYEQILTEPGLSFKLNAKLIYDAKWNRALNLVDLADWYLNTGYNERPQPTRAHTCTIMAIAEVSACKDSYRTKKDITRAESFLSDLEASKEIIENTLDGIAAILPTCAP